MSHTGTGTDALTARRASIEATGDSGTILFTVIARRDSGKFVIVVFLYACLAGIYDSVGVRFFNMYMNFVFLCCYLYSVFCVCGDICVNLSVCDTGNWMLVNEI